MVEFVDGHALSQASLGLTGGFAAAALIGVLRNRKSGTSGTSDTSGIRLAMALCTVAVFASGLFAGDSPTGNRSLDVGYIALLSLLMGPLLARANQWALLVAAAPPTLFIGLGGSWSLTEALACFAPLGAALALVSLNRSSTAARLLTALSIGVSLFWYPTQVRSAAPSVVAALVVCALTVSVAISGWARRTAGAQTRSVQRLTIGAVVAVAFGGLLVGALFAAQQIRNTKTELENSVSVLTNSLDDIDSLDVATTQASLKDAALRLNAADKDLQSPVWKLAALTPIGAQNTTAVRALVSRSLSVVSVADGFLQTDPIGRLRRTDGSINVGSLTDFMPTLEKLNVSLTDLDQGLTTERGPWIVGPVQEKIDRFSPYIARALTNVETATNAAKSLPEILGADQPRRYLMVFPTPSEARGSGGNIGNWGEIEIDNGKISLKRFDRILPLLRTERPWQERADTFVPGYLDRYEKFDPKQFFQNLLVSPDFPTNAYALAGQYFEAMGSNVDGVISVDPYGLAAILALEGPLTVEELPEPVTSETAPKLLLHDLYVQAGESQAERVSILETIARATFDRITGIPLDEPERIASSLGPALRSRRIQIWSKNPGSQAYLASVGASGRYVPDTPKDEVLDRFGVVMQNASGNKIDWFVSHTIDYRARLDEGNRVSVTATVDVQNLAPPTGLPRYIIGNVIKDREVAWGTATELISIYSKLELESASVSGSPIVMKRSTDLGLNVYDVFIDVAPLSRTKLELTFRGQLSSAAAARKSYDIGLLYQPAVNPDQYSITVSKETASQTQQMTLTKPETVSFPTFPTAPTAKG